MFPHEDLDDAGIKPVVPHGRPEQTYRFKGGGTCQNTFGEAMIEKTIFLPETGLYEWSEGAATAPGRNGLI
jgi:hypothetical protein